MSPKSGKSGESTQTGLTLLLKRMQQGDREAGERAAALVYSELHRIAAREMRNERHDNLLQTTALVSEAYVRLAEAGHLDIQNRGHFFALASQQMRRILVDTARARKAQRRGGGAFLLDVDQVQVSASSKTVDVIELDEALAGLERVDSRAAKVVELRFFGGYTDKQVVEALGVSLATVRRDWAFARAWLFDRIGRK
jgi:RNA polymerase sigma-70 factor (ECF subfamily)